MPKWVWQKAWSLPFRGWGAVFIPNNSNRTPTWAWQTISDLALTEKRGGGGGGRDNMVTLISNNRQSKCIPPSTGETSLFQQLNNTYTPCGTPSLGALRFSYKVLNVRENFNIFTICQSSWCKQKQFNFLQCNDFNRGHPRFFNQSQTDSSINGFWLPQRAFCRTNLNI